MVVDNIDMEDLFDRAVKASETAYAPYSKFLVGAALLAEDGSVYTVCNIENRTYGLSVCAETVALFKAVSEGRRSFMALAMAAPDSPLPVGLCGACRHRLSEFIPPDALIRFGGGGKEQVNVRMGELLPYDSFHSGVAGMILTQPPKHQIGKTR